MAKNIKTKEVVKDIKIHETAGNTAAKVKNIGVKTKETVDDRKIKQDNPSAEQYAADKVTDEMRRAAEASAVTANSTVKKGVSKFKKQIKNKRDKKEENPENPTPDDTKGDENLSDEIENTPKDDKADSSASEPKADTTESDKEYPNDKKQSDSGSSDSKKEDIKSDSKNDNKNGQTSKDKTTGSEMTITQAISALNAEYYEKLTSMEASHSCDTIEVQGDIPIPWKDVLAVYAVKTTTSTDDPMEVVTIDDDKLDILRKIVSDMNTMSDKVTTKTAQDEKVKVLVVTITHLSADEASELYNFDAEQKAQLSELMSTEYDSLWKELNYDKRIIRNSGTLIFLT